MRAAFRACCSSPCCAKPATTRPCVPDSDRVSVPLRAVVFVPLWGSASVCRLLLLDLRRGWPDRALGAVLSYEDDDDDARGAPNSPLRRSLTSAREPVGRSPGRRVDHRLLLADDEELEALRVECVEGWVSGPSSALKLALLALSDTKSPAAGAGAGTDAGLAEDGPG